MMVYIGITTDDLSLHLSLSHTFKAYGKTLRNVMLAVSTHL